MSCIERTENKIKATEYLQYNTVKTRCKQFIRQTHGQQKRLHAKATGTKINVSVEGDMLIGLASDLTMYKIHKHIGHYLRIPRIKPIRCTLTEQQAAFPDKPLLTVFKS